MPSHFSRFSSPSGNPVLGGGLPTRGGLPTGILGGGGGGVNDY